MPDTKRIGLELAPLPLGFSGTPQQFAEAMVERMRVLFPTGHWTFVIQDTEPETNQGPWINGQQIFLWNEEEKRYLPMDISNVWQVAISKTAPTDPVTSPIWIQYTDTNNQFLVLGIFVMLNGVWVPCFNQKGTTLERPVGAPNYFRYFDTDIEVEIFYRGIWRTVSGSPGDVKFVKFPKLADALKYNPGWSEFGQVMGPARGRVFMPAHKDYGENPAATFAPLVGITATAATDYKGEETTKLTIAQLPKHDHPSWARPLTYPPTGGQTGQSGGGNDAFAYTEQKTGLTGNDEAHTNMQPSLALWCLVKDV